MSDQENKSFSDSFEGLSQGQRENDGFFNNKHVSFDQKKALLQFMLDHEEFAFQDQGDEDKWEPLINILNNHLDGAIRPKDHWKKTWKLWCGNVQKRREDLSITLLDLQLLKFIDRRIESENMKKLLKTFINDPEKSVNSEQLQLAMQIIANLKTDILVELISQLKEFENKEKFHKSNLDIHTQRFSELMIKKQDLENEIDGQVMNINQEETSTVIAISEKLEILENIKKYLRQIYN